MGPLTGIDPKQHADDARRMAAALALAERTRGRTSPNPNVGCVIVAAGRVVGRGWTAPGGRPHAEATALAQAGDLARGATAYVTLEPCAHVSARGPACADLLIAAGVARVIGAIEDPDPRTAGAGYARLRAAGIAVTVGVAVPAARRSMAGFLTRQALGRPLVTLKLATSLDGAIALASGESRWITGPEARAHVHLERSRHELILVGRGTWDADAPGLDVRLPGLEARSPMRVVLSAGGAGPATAGHAPSPAEAGAQLPDGSASHRRGATGPRPSPGWEEKDRDGVSNCARHSNPTPVRHPGEGWGLAVGEDAAFASGDPSLRRGDEMVAAATPSSAPLVIASPAAIADLPGDHLFVEGGAQTAAAFLAADLVDRLLLYRAPILIGGGQAAIGDIGLTGLDAAHGRWRRVDARALGSDRLEVYERATI